jgi:hypothetical protein
MTKKSASRLARDAQKENNKNNPVESSTWDDLEEIHDAHATALFDANRELIDLYKISGIRENIPDKESTAVSLRGLGRDIKDFTMRLTEIHQKHNTRKGSINMDIPEDHALAFNLASEYTTFADDYRSVILPNVIFLAEQADLSRQVLQRVFQAKADITNPNVVTDVVIKESPAIVENQPENI